MFVADEHQGHLDGDRPSRRTTATPSSAARRSSARRRPPPAAGLGSGGAVPQEARPSNGQAPADQSDLLKNIRESNGLLQRTQGEQLHLFYQQDNKGVKAREAF